MKRQEQFYLVKEDVLSESMTKVLEAKTLLENGQAENVTDAAEKVGLSRSAFYKYRNSIFPFHKIVTENIVTLFFFLEDRTGTLTKLLNIVSQAGCNVLTIHQTIPLQGKANVSLSIDTNAINRKFDDFVDQFRQMAEVIKVDVVGSGGL
ncbi:ACT domain-containing protein [Tuberibacillus sp. Marseille-P3662]|uniref:ACT domain-containing protein n=1 Tax=Tuberibacillus sp. Marseille-P3662 TaxID=1965358 RepID=UPI000A1CC663|nr:ACT domain-containing protein [Tuberibacillus sp. Marseille-P3662]